MPINISHYRRPWKMILALWWGGKSDWGGYRVNGDEEEETVIVGNTFKEFCWKGQLKGGSIARGQSNFGKNLPWYSAFQCLHL